MNRSRQSNGSDVQLLRDERVTLTGRFASMRHVELAALIEAAGGTYVTTLSQRTTILVVGMDGWPLAPDGRVPSKLQRAEDMARLGAPLEILSEAAFLERIGLGSQTSELRKSYPADTVAAIVGVSIEQVRRWEHLGLVHSDHGRYDFQDIVSLRTLTELMQRGVDPRVIRRSIRQLARVLPHADRPLAQLTLVVDDDGHVLADLGDALMSPDGQFVIPFREGTPHEQEYLDFVAATDAYRAREWFSRGQRAEDLEDYVTAIDAYERAVALLNPYPEAWFNLGNMFRIVGNLEAARDAFQAATRQDPGMAAAWYNLGGIQAELGDTGVAITALTECVGIAPEYADAHFNLAACLEAVGDIEGACVHWRLYVSLDPGSEWAAIARQHLRSHELRTPSHP